MSLILNEKKNSFWLAIQYSSTIVISLVTLKINFSTFGVKDFGVFLLINSLWNFAAVIDFGMGTSLVRYVSIEIKEKKEKLTLLLSSSFFILLFTTFIITCIILVITYFLYIKGFGNSDTLDENILGTILIILSLSFALRYMTTFFKAALEGKKLYNLTSKIGVLGNLINLMGVGMVASITGTLKELALVYFVTAVTVLLLQIYVFFKVYGWNVIKLSSFSLQTLKNISSFSFSIQGANLLGGLIDPLIKYFLSKFISTNMVSYYEVARRFTQSISGLYFTSFSNYLPKISEIHQFDEQRKFIMNEIKSLTNFGIIFSGLSFGIFSIVILVIIKYWFGANQIAILFLILALPEIVNNFGYPLYITLLGIGESFIIVFLQLFNVTGIATLIVILSYFQKDLNLLLSYFIVVQLSNIMMLSFVKKRFKIPLLEFCRKVKLYKIVVLLVIIILSILILQVSAIEVLVVFLAITIISIMIFGRDLGYLSKQIYSFIKIK